MYVQTAKKATPARSAMIIVMIAAVAMGVMLTAAAIAMMVFGWAPPMVAEGTSSSTLLVLGLTFGGVGVLVLWATFHEELTPA